MRAVNLIPEDERRGAGGAAGRSGGAAFVLLAMLGVLVLVTTAYTLQRRSVTGKRAELVRTEALATQSEARAAALGPYSQFAGLRDKRVATVKDLAASRFDWSHSLHELARVIPSSAWLTSLRGTVAPGVALKAGGGGASSLRSAIPSPAIEIVGCSVDQDSVARMVTRMRLIDGVSRVALQSSVKDDAATASGASGSGASGSDADCRQGTARYPQFSLVVFFDQAAGAVPTAALTTTTSVAATATGATGATGPAAPTGATP